MTTVYAITQHISAILWALTLLYCSPGLWRVVLGGQKRSDLLSVLLSAIAFNYAGYAAIRLLFWDPERFSEAELLARIILALFSIVCVFVSIAVLHQYRRRETIQL